MRRRWRASRGRCAIARLARYMAGFDLVLSYNWGAMDAVMAHRLFAPFMRLPPLIHHEDGFNADEVGAAEAEAGAGSAGWRCRPRTRWWCRRERLERIARDVWRQPARADRADRQRRAGRARRRAAGGRCDPRLRAGARARWWSARSPGCARSRTCRGWCAPSPRVPAPPARLVIVGEGPERGAILAEAARCGVADRLVLPGFLPDPLGYVGLFDIFALSSDSEQFPISLVEAMAAGLPAVVDRRRRRGGDGRGGEPRRSSSPPADEADWPARWRGWLGDRGAARARSARPTGRRRWRCFDEAAMIGHYRALYAGALGPGGRAGLNYRAQSPARWLIAGSNFVWRRACSRVCDRSSMAAARSGR